MWDYSNKMKFSHTKLCFYMCFLSQTLMIHRTKGVEILTSLFLSTNYTCLQTSCISLQFWNPDKYLVFLIAMHAITRLLLDEIYPLLKIRIWLKIVSLRITTLPFFLQPFLIKPPFFRNITKPLINHKMSLHQLFSCNPSLGTIFI